MKKVLNFAAVAEAVTGLALLIVPSLVGQLLFGEGLTGVAIPVARVTGIALIARGRLLAGSAARRHVDLQRIGYAVSCVRWFRRRLERHPLLEPRSILLMTLRRLLQARKITAHEWLYPLSETETAAGGLGLVCAPLCILHNFNRHAEVDEPRLQERQRQHVLRVDIVCAVAGVGSDVEL